VVGSNSSSKVEEAIMVLRMEDGITRQGGEEGIEAAEAGDYGVR
jgi:hypothetical protein